MEDKFLDFVKIFDPKAAKTLEALNITKVIKQLEQLKLSGLLERIEDLNNLPKLLKQMEDLKLSELVKKIEEIKLSSIIKQIEDNKLNEIIDKISNPLKALKEPTENTIEFQGGVIKIETKQDSIPDQILKLEELRKKGLITREEMEKKKKELLARM
jgi:hypothetical protein